MSRLHGASRYYRLASSSRILRNGGVVLGVKEKKSPRQWLGWGKKSKKHQKIGEQVWMAENLNYGAEGSKCYEDKPENCQKYGRLYNWETAKKACPAGWHLPIGDEWTALVNVGYALKTALNAIVNRDKQSGLGNAYTLNKLTVCFMSLAIFAKSFALSFTCVAP